MKPWNIKQIVDELNISFAMCHTDLERSVWRTVVRSDLERVLGGRKPTPAERAVLDKFGIYY